MILWWFDGDFMVINGDFMVINGDFMVINGDFMVILWYLMVILWWFNGIYTLVNQQNYGKSPTLLGKLSVNGHVHEFSCIAMLTRK